MQADYARHDAPREAATLLEALAATGKPVLAGQGGAPRPDGPALATLAAS